MTEFRSERERRAEIADLIDQIYRMQACHHIQLAARPDVDLDQTQLDHARMLAVGIERKARALQEELGALQTTGE